MNLRQTRRSAQQNQTQVNPDEVIALELTRTGRKMGTTTKISFEEFRKLQDEAPETVRYELDEGELMVTPSPTPCHNIARYRLRHALTDFVQKNSLGLILDETDFLLSANTVRKPDIAFITKERLKTLDLDHVPIDGAPALVIEVISPTNLAEDTLKKVRQYLAGGSKAVWIVYPICGWWKFTMQKAFAS